MRALNTLTNMMVKDAKNIGIISKRSLMNLISNLLGDAYVMQVIRGQVVKAAGAKVALNVRIRAPAHMENPENLEIGAGSFINKEIYLDNTGAKITIGNNVMIGFRVSMTTSNHDFKTRETIHKPVTIEDDVWIGACSTILPGVTIGKGAVVASGAVVTSDVSPYTIVGGVPARAIKSIELTASPILVRIDYKK